jgi:geranylgeranyl diphosphate synthase type II
MIAGQVADMGLCELPDGCDGVRIIHLSKTAALIRASARMGALCGGVPPGGSEEMARLTEWSENLGLAYQVVDDILDVTGTAERLGKTPGKDAQSGKRNAAVVVGLEKAGELADQLTGRAVEALGPLGARAEELLRLTRALAGRTA